MPGVPNMREDLRCQLPEALKPRLSSAAWLLTDHEGRLLLASPAFEALVGHECEPLLGTRPPWPWWPSWSGRSLSQVIRFLTADGAADIGLEEFSCNLVLADQKRHQAGIRCVRVPCEGPRPEYHAFEIRIPTDETDSPLEDPGQALPREEVARIRAELQRIAREIDELLPSAGPVRTTGAAPGPEPPSLGTLTTREMEVLDGLVEGKRSREIAQQLFVSVHTVRNHVRAIFRKLEVHSQVELIKKVDSGFWGGGQRP